jgi:hypothetical protein
VRSYTSPDSFKDALEARLRGPRLVRERQLVVFERFLARAWSIFGRSVILKGGLALELRIGRARTTRDVDLRLTVRPEELLSKLQMAGRQDLGDFMRFEISGGQLLSAAGMPYGGRRYRAECRMGGRPYGQPFQVDVTLGEPFFGEPDLLIGHNRLAFAGIPDVPLLLYPVEAHIAEKLHAYTLPRTGTNSRVKDLPDLALLGTTRKVLHLQTLRSAIDQTFHRRGTHPSPPQVPDPPVDPKLDWSAAYTELVSENDLPWPTLSELVKAVRSFLDPVLAHHRAEGVWSPDRWSWQ